MPGQNDIIGAGVKIFGKEKARRESGVQGKSKGQR